jgi:nucleotide-binding universal stress UspA family protein
MGMLKVGMTMWKGNRVILICEDEPAVALKAFGRYVSGLLGTEMVLWQRPREASRRGSDWWREVAEGGDLLLVERRERSALERVLGGAAEGRLAAAVAAPVLFAHEPRWPFAHFLLVLRDTAADEPAIGWTLRLAAASGAAVTMLLVVPSQPALYATGSRVQAELEVLLAPNTPIGKKTRQVAAALLAAGAPGLAVHQQRGAPDRQMRQEMAVGDYDLVVIGAERGGRLYRWYMGELVPSLVRWCGCPVLVAERAERSMRVEMADG